MDSNQILTDKDFQLLLLGGTKVHPTIQAAVLKTQKKCHISATVWLFLTNIGPVIHLDLCRWPAIKINRLTNFNEM